MIPSRWSLLLGGMGWFVAASLTVAWMVLTRLSGGTARKLEPSDKDLAGRVEFWLAKREELGVTLRFLLGLDLLLVIACVSSWDSHCAQDSLGLWPRAAPAVVGFVAFFATTEWAGAHLSGRRAARFLSCVMPVVRLAGAIVFPLVFPITAWRCWVVRWRREHLQDEGKASAEDEIMSLVEQDGTNGDGEPELEADERRMIRGVFDLDETLVHEIMTPRVDVHAIEDTTSIAEVKAEIVASGHSRIPVYHGTVDQIVGVVYAKDLLDDRALADAPSLSDVDHRPVFIPETKNIGDLLAEFQQSRNHFAVVLDEYGGTAGIVTFEDILEEIVGEIRDEYDADEPQVTKEELPDGSLVVDGRVTVDELEEALDIELPECQDFDTLGGYVSAHAGRIPQAGEVLQTDQLTLEIVSADPRRVLRAKIRRTSDAAAAGEGG